VTHVKISVKNSKLGRIPNISLVPVESCPNSGFCRELCYARPIYRRFPATKAAWSRNWEMFKHSPKNYRDSIIYMLKHGKLGTSGLFRWHVGGDIPNQEYVGVMTEVADAFPETSFLAFTKAYSMDYSGILDNMHIVYSAWAGMPISTDFPIAYVKELDNRGEDHEIVYDCVGDCRSCRQCWEAEKGSAINLHLHGVKAKSILSTLS